MHLSENGRDRQDFEEDYWDYLRVNFEDVRLLDDGIQIYLAMHKADLTFRESTIPPVDKAELHGYQMYLMAVLKKSVILEKYYL